MKFHLCIALAGLSLAGQASADSPPQVVADKLACAATYGILAARSDTPRSRAAAAARAQLTEEWSETYDRLIEADAAAAKEADLADQRAGDCDRKYKFKVAEMPGQPFQAAKPPPQPMVVAAPAAKQPMSGKGVLWSSCHGERLSFDAGLSRDDLIADAQARGCTALDIDTLLTTRDLLF